MHDRHEIRSVSVARWESHVPSQRAMHLGHRSGTKQLATPSSPRAGHWQKTSFHTLGTKLCPATRRASPAFPVRLQAPFLRFGRPHAKHRAQATVNEARRSTEARYAPYRLGLPALNRPKCARCSKTDVLAAPEQAPAFTYTDSLFCKFGMNGIKLVLAAAILVDRFNDITQQTTIRKDHKTVASG